MAEIEISPQWTVDETASPPGSVMTAAVTICGARVMLLAVQIIHIDLGEDGASYALACRTWDDLPDAFAMDGYPETFEHGGRHYAVFASPECK